MHESLQSFWRHLTLPPGTKWEELNYSVKNDKLIITIPMITDEFQQNEQSENYDYRAADYPTKNSAPLLIKNQEYADHWSRYSPPRHTSWL